MKNLRTLKPGTRRAILACEVILIVITFAAIAVSIPVRAGPGGGAGEATIKSAAAQEIEVVRRAVVDPMKLRATIKHPPRRVIPLRVPDPVTYQRIKTAVGSGASSLNAIATGPNDGGLWLVVIDGQPYLRLADRAFGRVQKNATNPYVKVKIAGTDFDKVRLDAAPDMIDKVAAAMADKYFMDILIRHESHPMTASNRGGCAGTGAVALSGACMHGSTFADRTHSPHAPRAARPRPKRVSPCCFSAADTASWATSFTGRLPIKGNRSASGSHLPKSVSKSNTKA